METDKNNIDYINKTFTYLLGDRYSTAESTRTNHARGEDIFDPMYHHLFILTYIT